MAAILQKTSTIIDELIVSINAAQSEILLQTFYFDNDAVGKSVLDALATKAKHGVKVTCLFDALGARGLINTKDEKLAVAAGVRIIYFNWLTPWSSGNKHFWYFRNHKRTLIVDQKLTYFGGWCIGRRAENWIEANLKLEEPGIVAKAVADFKNMVTYAHKTSFKFKHEGRYIFNPEIETSYTYQAPLPRSRYIYYTLLKLIRYSKKHIILVSPYFSPSGRFLKEIKRALERGVIVTIHRPAKTDHKITDLAARTYYQGLLNRGAEIYLSEKMIHAKVCVFDDVAYIGSSNLDSGSQKFNFENGVFTKRIEIVESLMQDTEYLKLDAKKLTLEEWNKRGWWSKCVEKLVRLVRGLL
jgi:cardiolipin synthase A/B